MPKALHVLALIEMSVVVLGVLPARTAAQSPDDPWAVQLAPGPSTSAALVVGSSQEGLDCPESPSQASPGQEGIAANIMCIIGGTRAGHRTTELPAPDPAASAPPPTAGEIVEGILSGAH